VSAASRGSERRAGGRTGWGTGRASRMLLSAGIAAVALAGPALAGHMTDWRHDHSKRGVPPRPDGVAELRHRFGGPACNEKANNARTWFPHAVSRNEGGYVIYHPYLAINVGDNIRNHIAAAHRNGALDYGIYGYNCRLKTGGSEWSVHAWGAAIDTNTARNPYGQDHWEGKGADGHDYGRYIPDLYRGVFPGHRFTWGKSWSDPHHFQYVSDY
jgi:D-alanyl-D-alanine carboxypeptidase